MDQDGVRNEVLTTVTVQRDLSPSESQYSYIVGPTMLQIFQKRTHQFAVDPARRREDQTGDSTHTTENGGSRARRKARTGVKFSDVRPSRIADGRRAGGAGRRPGKLSSPAHDRCSTRGKRLAKTWADNYSCIDGPQPLAGQGASTHARKDDYGHGNDRRHDRRSPTAVYQGGSAGPRP